MYEMAHKAREAMKGKAKRLAGEKDGKTDSSDWSPAEPLNANVKTGMRPISPRAYKKGGKVMGEKADCHAGRKPRKSGGRAITADSLINRNQKEANESREGKKHIGGMKKGGEVKKKEGGFLRTLGDRVAGDLASDEAKNIVGNLRGALSGESYKKGGRTGKALGGSPTDVLKQIRQQTMGFKKGGKIKKAEGGMADYDTGSRTGAGAVTQDRSPAKAAPPMPPRRPAEPDYDTGSRTGAGAVTRTRKEGGKVNYGPAENVGGKPGVSTKEQIAIENKGEAASKPKRGKAGHYADGGAPIPVAMTGPDPRMGLVNKNALNFGAGAPGSPYKKGGMAKHEDVAEDKALIKKMVKPEARTGKAAGGEKWIAGAIKHKGALHKALGVPQGEKIPEKKLEKAEHSSNPKLAKRARLAETLKGMNRPGKYYGGGLGLPNMGPGKPAGLATGGKAAKGKTSINIMINPGAKPDQSAGLPGTPPGMPPGMPPGGVPVPMGMPPGGAPGPAAPMPMPIPMPMPAAAPSPMARKAGGKVYRSYKDMDAGAGSGLGRLEKTEIQKRKA